MKSVVVVLLILCTVAITNHQIHAHSISIGGSGRQSRNPNHYHVRPLEDCWNYNGVNQCSGQQTDQSPAWAPRVFQTPQPNDPIYPNYIPTFQNMSHIVGYPKLSYNYDRSSVQVSIYTKWRRVDPSKSYTLQYIYNLGGVKTISSSVNTLTLYAKTSEGDGQLYVTVLMVSTSDQNVAAQLVLEPVDFIWNHPVIPDHPIYLKGQKGAIIEMFGWPYKGKKKNILKLIHIVIRY